MSHSPVSTEAEHEMLEELGHDVYGKVITYYELVEKAPARARLERVESRRQTLGDKVAIKELKEFNGSSWKDTLNLREVKALRGLDHPNIVKLEQLIMENNKLVKKYSDNDQVRSAAIQLFQALAHRTKEVTFIYEPDNILVSTF
ncbi:hypothetical protein Syun_018520 [Stephania yunnanensis]|uniref:Protein kinase domain-containing protein n=1 Tax=Stephania yunnanensis TaxID=152371 RepID=A0AAP0ITX1_9MAGN